MGEWTPLYISLGIVFVVGFFIPMLVTGFVPEGQTNPNSFISGYVDFVENGFTAGEVALFGWTVFEGINFNPFSWLGDTFHNFYLSQLQAFSFIPNVIAVPLLFISFIGVVYTVIKMLPTT